MLRSAFTYTFIYYMLIFGPLFVSCAAGQKTNSGEQQAPTEDAQLKQEIATYLSLGWENYKNKQYDRAIEQFKKVLELDPKNEKAYKFLSDAYLRHPDTTFVDSALALYKDGISKFPQNAYFYAGLGYVYQKIGMNLSMLADSTADSATAAHLRQQAEQLEDMALQNFVSAFLLNDKDAISATNAATILLRKGLRDSAVVWFEKSAEIDSNQVIVWEALSLLYEIRNNYEKAAISYGHLHRLKPEEPENLLKMGQYLAKSGKFIEANEILDKYIAANPDDYRGYQYKGLALNAVGNTKDALEQFKKAESLFCKSVKLMCDIANVYREMKQYAKAESYIARAKELDRGYGYIYIIEGEIQQQRAMDMLPESGELNMEVKCQFIVATKLFQKALSDPAWSTLARAKIDYLKPYLPTKEEIAAYKHMTGKSCGD